MANAVGVTSLERLQEKLGYAFVNQELLAQAIRHRSSVPIREGDSEQSAPGGVEWHNERLEFLGDAVLNLLISRILFQLYPRASEGMLSQWRAHLVNTRSLSSLGRELELGSVLQLGRGEALSGGRDKRSILAGTLEAILGAAYLDGGESAAALLVEHLFGQQLREIEPDHPGKDYKSLLQELLQAAGRELPVYRVVAISGAPHQRVFSVECLVEEHPPGCGGGSSKRLAEQEAARMVLAHLDSRENG